jgi:hypothetical protein
MNDNIVTYGGRTYNPDVSDNQQNPDLWVMGGGVIEKDLNIKGTSIISGNVEFGATPPISGDVLTFDGYTWAPAAPSGGGDTSVPGWTTAVLLPNSDNTAFTPVPGVSYFCDLFTSHRTLTMTAASLAPLNLSPGDVFQFTISEATKYAYIAPSSGSTANGVTGADGTWGIAGPSCPVNILCTGIGTYTVFAFS